MDVPPEPDCDSWPARKVGPWSFRFPPLWRWEVPENGKRDPCYSHRRIPKDLGMVSEAYHKVVPGITLDNTWSNCGKMNAPPRLIAVKKSRALSHGETLLQLIVDVGPGRVLDHLGPRCFCNRSNHQLQPRF